MLKKLFISLFIVFLLIPSFGFAQGEDPEPQKCIFCSEAGGLVPCGRKCDDPTTLKNECEPCTICDFFVVADRLADVLMTKIVPAIAVLIIFFAGFLMIFSYLGKVGPEAINKSKKVLMGVVIGLAVVYGAWILINTTLMVLGFVDWENMEDWWKVDCEIKAPEPIGLCGDSIIQRPNSEGALEVCDRLALGDETCETRGFNGGGTLFCTDDCLGFDTTYCKQKEVLPELALPDLPKYPPLNPSPTVAPYEGDGPYEWVFRKNSYWKYDPCTSTGFAHHWIYGDTKSYTFYNYPGGEAVMKVSCNKEACSGWRLFFSGDKCCQRYKTVECLNEHVLVEPDNLGRCERGSVVFKRVSATKANYSCTSYKHNNASEWNYVCQRDSDDPRTFPPPSEDPVIEDPNALPPSRCEECGGEGLFGSPNLLGRCEEDECYALGEDCNWVPVSNIWGKIGGMCVYNNDCSSCGTAIYDDCKYAACRATGPDCRYIAPEGMMEGGICVNVQETECSKCSQIPGGCTEEFCYDISPDCNFVNGSCINN